MSKDEFIDKKALDAFEKKNEKKLYGITSEKPIVHRSKVFLTKAQKVGYLSACTWSPTLNKFVGYVRFDYADNWKEHEVKVEDVNGNLLECQIVDLPFYDKKKLIPKGLDKNIP